MADKSSSEETSIGLVGDGDEVFLLEEVETLFDIKLDSADLEKVMNVGDLFDLIMELGRFENRPTACCYSQKGFHRLRQRLRLLGLQRKITPKTPVRDVLDELGTTYSQFGRHISLDLASEHMPCPQVPLDRVWMVRCILAAAVVLWISGMIIGAELMPGYGWPLIGVFGFGFFVSCLLTCFQTELPLYCETVGGLARVYGTACFDDDDDAIRKASTADIWDRLCVCLRSDNGYAGPIDRETLFFGEQREFPAPR